MNNLSPDQEWLKMYTLLSTIFIIIFNNKNKLVCIIIYIMLSLFSFFHMIYVLVE